MRTGGKSVSSMWTVSNLNYNIYSRISALGPECHRTSCFKSDVYLMSTSCGRPQGEGPVSLGRRGRGKSLISL